jgi:hypothetical protein
MKATKKKYQCKGCNCKTKEYVTNHYGDTYNEPCNICESEERGALQTFRCLDVAPTGDIERPKFKAFIL